MATSDRPLPQYLPLQPQSIDNTKTESGKQGDGRSREDTEHLLFSQHPHLPLQQHPARLQHLLPAGMFSNTIGFSPLTCHTLCSSCCLTLCSPCCLTLCSPCCVNLCSPCCPTLCSPCCLTLCSPCCLTLCSPCCLTLCSPCCLTLCSPCVTYHGFGR